MPTTTAHAARPQIVVDGVPLEDELTGYVETLIVDDQLDLPTMFAITLVDPDRDILDRSGLRVAATVDLSVVDEEDQQEKPLATGDVVSVECEYDQMGARVTVRGYAESHRLHRGRRTRTFINVTDSEIVQKVADEAGIDVDEIEATSEVHEYVAQANVSDWELISSRARLIGFELGVVDGKLHFGPPSESTEAPPESPPGSDEDPSDPRQLVSGKNLLAFHGRLSSAAQVGEVEVRGWDSDKKEPVVGSAPAGTVAAGLDLAEPSSLASLFGDHTFVAVERRFNKDSEVDQVAKALAERIGSSFVEADGVCRGKADLKAGSAVYVSGVGEDFSGRYTLSHVRHVIDPDGYHSHFTVSGRQNRSLLGVVASAGPGSRSGWSAAGGSQHIGGLVRGIVDDNADPMKLGRVKIRLPWLADDFSSHWAPVMQLGAGPSSGTMFLPAVNDEVLVGFEHGQVDRPIVIGGLFNSLDQPPEYSRYLDNGAVLRRSIVSRLGHQIALSDDPKEESGIAIVTKDATVGIGMNAREEKLFVRANGGIEVKTDGELKLSAAKITVEADGQLVLKGAQIKLN